MRKAFTLIETLVALVILEFAMLALAAATAVAARDFAAAHRGIKAQEIARNRLEELTATACAGPQSGSRVVAGYTERWEIAGDIPLRSIAVRVEYALSRGRRGDIHLRSSVLCRQ